MGRTATKRIHYVRAVYNEGMVPQRSFSDMVRSILARSPNIADTEIVTQSLGTIAIREKNARWQEPDYPILLAIGAGAARERMATMGIGVPSDTDDDAAEEPPIQRAFKTSDAFVLIDGFDLLVCTDGVMKGYRSVSYYFSRLFEAFSLPPVEQAFELEPKSDQGSVDLVTREGVKKIELSGVMYQAANAPARDETQAGNIFGRLAGDFQGWLAGSLPDEQREAAADQWAEMNVTTTLTPKGGKRAEPVILESMRRASLDMLDEVPGSLDITLVTKENNRVTPMDVTLSKTFRMNRRRARNDLPTLDVWGKLEDYRGELIDLDTWRT